MDLCVFSSADALAYNLPWPLSHQKESQSSPCDCPALPLRLPAATSDSDTGSPGSGFLEPRGHGEAFAHNDSLLEFTYLVCCLASPPGTQSPRNRVLFVILTAVDLGTLSSTQWVLSKMVLNQ